MHKTLVCSAFLVLVLCLGVGTAFGQDCDKFNVILKPGETYVDDDDLGDYDFLAEHFGVEPFEWCWSQRVIGTVQGRWALCGNNDLAIFDPFGLGIGPELWGNPGFILTKKGDMIYTMSYGLAVWGFDGDFSDVDAFGGLTTFYGGTGAYAGATGWSTDSPKKYPATFWLQSRGFLCVSN